LTTDRDDDGQQSKTNGGFHFFLSLSFEMFPCS
jgi:hypothetical protein